MPAPDFVDLSTKLRGERKHPKEACIFMQHGGLRLLYREGVASVHSGTYIGCYLFDPIIYLHDVKKFLSIDIKRAGQLVFSRKFVKNYI